MIDQSLNCKLVLFLLLNPVDKRAHLSLPSPDCHPPSELF